MKRAFRGKLKGDMEALISAFHYFIATEAVKIYEATKENFTKDDLFTDRTDIAHINFCNKFDDLFQKLAIRVWEEGFTGGYKSGHTEGFNIALGSEFGVPIVECEKIKSIRNPYKVDEEN